MNKDIYFINGNVIRKTVPDKRSHNKSCNKYKVTKKRVIRKNRSRLLSMPLKTLIIYGMCLIAVTFVLINFMQTRSSVTILAKQKSELQTQVERI